MTKAASTSKTLKVSVTMTVRGLGGLEALLLKDLLLDGDRSGTMLTDNIGLYDYDLSEHIEDVVIE